MGSGIKEENSITPGRQSAPRKYRISDGSLSSMDASYGPPVAAGVRDIFMTIVSVVVTVVEGIGIIVAAVAAVLALTVGEFLLVCRFKAIGGMPQAAEWIFLIGGMYLFWSACRDACALGTRRSSTAVKPRRHVPDARAPFWRSTFSIYGRVTVALILVLLPIDYRIAGDATLGYAWT